MCLTYLQMFVRWKRRKTPRTKLGRAPRRHDDAGDSLYCVLVESQRINGSPRQKLICYLGSIKESYIERPWVRLVFWEKVRVKLDKIALARTDRIKVEESIGRVIPKVSEEEVAAFKKARAEYYADQAARQRKVEVMRYFGFELVAVKTEEN